MSGIAAESACIPSFRRGPAIPMADVLCGPRPCSGGGVAGAHECIPRSAVRVKLERVAAKHLGESRAQSEPEPKQFLPLFVKIQRPMHRVGDLLMTSSQREAPCAPFANMMFPSNAVWLFL